MPIWSFLSAPSLKTFGSRRKSFRFSAVTLTGLKFAVHLGLLPSNFAADAADLAFEVTKAGLLRVLADDLGDRLAVESDVIFARPFSSICFGIRWRRAISTFPPLCSRKARWSPSGREGGLDGVEHVRGRHEHHVRQVERDAEIVVAK